MCKDKHEIYDEDGLLVYRKTGNLVERWEYDEYGNCTFYESSDGYWIRNEYDKSGNVVFAETPRGWTRWEYDESQSLLNQVIRSNTNGLGYTQA